MPLFRIADAKLLNFDRINQNLSVRFHGNSIKHIYSSYNYISSGLSICGETFAPIRLIVLNQCFKD